MIRFEKITKKYPGHKNALDNVTVKVDDGEFMFLIGPSGAGKTTLLRLLMRDINPSKGEVYVDDVDISQISRSKLYLLRRKIGMVFQDYKLLNDRTVFENVAIGLDILGKKQNTIQKDVSDILKLVGLKDKMNLFPQQLSAGEMQRTSIARAVIGGPKILLADEPTGNLDPEISAEILNILIEINKIGTTVIMATHNTSIVNQYKKRTVILDEGIVVSDEKEGTYKTKLKSKKDNKNSAKTNENSKRTVKESLKRSNKKA